MAEEQNTFNLTLTQKIIIATMILVAFLPPLISSHYQSTEEFWLEIHLRSDYTGIIESKFLDKNNHMANTVKFKNGEKTSHFNDYYHELAVGDSLVKDQNSVYLYIYRKGFLIKKVNLYKLQLSLEKK